ncbi:MAG: NAD(P)/FAD-dependent oxidoreductase [Bryobacteraceae bacterium]
MFYAAEAARLDRRVVVLEHSSEPGRKILVSGGGRCNFTNRHTRPENFLSSNPHFAKSALARYTPADFIDLVEQHRISYHEKKLGQLFCDNSARDILAMLLQECGPVVRCNTRIAEVRRTTEFVVETSQGTLTAPALVIASGGLSIPKMGATSFGYEVARQFGHKIQPCRPALVPLLHDGPALAGVSTEVIARHGKISFQENLLFTHRGLSGPAILQISSYWKPGTDIEIDLQPQTDIESSLLNRKRANDRAALRTALSAHLPQRLADSWLPGNAAARPVATLPDAELRTLAQGLHHWRVRPTGTEGYAKAEVTAGGVDTTELSAQTLESRLVPGLHFIGEVVDVTGHLGGFNFQWAWASAAAAARSLALSV